MISILSNWRLIVAAFAFAAAFAGGWAVRGWKADAELKAAAEGQVKAVADVLERARADQDKAIADTRAALLAEAKVEKIQTVERIRYVKAPAAPSHCVLPDATYGMLVDAIHRANTGGHGPPDRVPDALPDAPRTGGSGLRIDTALGF